MKKKLGYKVWDNRNVSYEKYNNYLSYTSKTPSKYSNPLSVSLWSAGASNSGEEYNNNYGVTLEEDSGYNLFRTSQNINDKPQNMNTYIIKEECLMPNNGKKPQPYTIDTSKITDGKDLDTQPENKHRYNTSVYFGKKPSQAILTNIDTDISEDKSINGITNKPLKMYLEDDLNKRKDPKKGETKIPPDTYFIKTLNTKKNDYSNCVIVDYRGNVKETSRCDKTNSNHLWSVDYDDTISSGSTAKINLKSNANNSTSTTTGNAPSESKKCLRQYYDTLGKSNFELVKCEDTNRRWSYDTPMVGELPRK